MWGYIFFDKGLKDKKNTLYYKLPNLSNTLLSILWFLKSFNTILMGSIHYMKSQEIVYRLIYHNKFMGKFQLNYWEYPKLTTLLLLFN